jgi:hypothetical protein
MKNKKIHMVSMKNIVFDEFGHVRKIRTDCGSRPINKITHTLAEATCENCKRLN